MSKRKRDKRTIPAPTPRSPDLRYLHKVESVIRHAPEPIRPRPPRPRPDFRPVEDLRHDTQDQTFRTRSGTFARQETRPQGEVSHPRLHTPLYTYFRDPHRVLVCIRRHTRQRVLFALRRIGKGRRVRREHRYTEKSYIRC